LLEDMNKRSISSADGMSVLRSHLDRAQCRPLLLLAVLTAWTTSIGTLCAAETAGREHLGIDAGAINKPWKGDLDGMIKRRAIRVLVVPSKTFYFVDKGVERGATHDFVRQFEDDLNKRLAAQKKLSNKNLKVRVFFVPVGRESVIAALNAGKGDIAATALTVTDSGKKLVDYSVPVYPNVDEIVVAAPGTVPINSVDELSGKVFYVRPSSSYRESLLALNQRLAAQKRAPVVIKNASENLEDEDLIEMVNAGLIPLTIINAPVAKFWKQVFPAIAVYENVAVRKDGDIAWAMRRESPQLKAAVDDFITRNGKGTAIGNMILARYLKDARYVKNAASAEDRKKFLALVGYFQKYGQEYDVDWLLMAAQGYQESQLNQQAKSQVGAIGIMQLMPATGKEMKVGDITQTEANIHAGVKYMRWMMDNYYGNEPMSKLDKALFAFASYNAGAGRISGLRKEATKRGLNPNVWFHNVEYVAAEKVGAETVTYVANIYKYYIAYRLILEQRSAKAKDATALKQPTP
jgi:membrane-bound lytic murein transglycosylase MltF